MNPVSVAVEVPPLVAGAATASILLLGATVLIGSPPTRRPASRGVLTPPRLDGARRRTAGQQGRWRLLLSLLIPVVVLSAAGGLWLPIVAVATGWVVWRRWSHARSAGRRAELARRSLPELIELLAIAVSAGRTPSQAVLDLSETAPPALQPTLEAIGHRMQHGHRFVEAIQVLREQFGLDAAGMVDLLVAADRDGLPIEPVLAQLAADARQQRRRDAEADARRLPVRLAAPLVLCTLPGFVLLAIVPLVAGALSSLSMP